MRHGTLPHLLLSLAAGLGLALSLTAQQRINPPPAEVQPLPTTPATQNQPETATPLPLPSSDIPETMQPDLTPPAVADNYQVGRDDLLSVFVFQMPELTTQVRVNSQGKVALPFFRRALPAAGMTPLQLQDAVQQELVSEGLARNPEVRVVVRQVESRPIIVSGAVRYPEVIQAARPMSLLEVLSRAGGLDNAAGTTVLVTAPSGSGPITTSLSVQTLLDDASGHQDPVLSGGETVRVIPARLVYAIGALQKPGAFPLVANEPITVLKILALSQGFSTTLPADKNHAEIIRTAADGSRQEVPVNLDQILHHRKPDVTLAAGDLLYVPESGKSKALGALLADVGTAATIFAGYHF